MIKNIEQIKDKPLSFIRTFINNCTIEEKLDTHYVIVEITSKNSITIKKASNKQIDRIDMILNNMWGELNTDWNYIKLANQEWFANHVGYTFYMFYFPSTKPLQTEYKPGIKYVIDRVVYNDEVVDTTAVINSLKMINKFNIKVKCNIDKIDNVSEICKQVNGNNKLITDYSSLFLSLIKDTNKVLALNNPEGYIFKNNKNLYQYLYNDPVHLNMEKTQYEYVLCDFITYCKTKGYLDKIDKGYVKTVCSLFNDYIINWESKRHNIEYNINVDSIKPPTHSIKADLGYEYIPDIITLNLCKQNLLYKRIFAVLLANLRKQKDNKSGIYMDVKQIDALNSIIKNIKVRTLYI